MQEEIKFSPSQFLWLELIFGTPVACMHMSLIKLAYDYAPYADARFGYDLYDIAVSIIHPRTLFYL